MLRSDQAVEVLGLQDHLLAIGFAQPHRLFHRSTSAPSYHPTFTTKIDPHRQKFTNSERLTGVNRNTVMSLGVRVGDGCERLHDRMMRDLQVNQIELDEQWDFIQKKQKRVQHRRSVRVRRRVAVRRARGHAKGRAELSGRETRD